MTKQKTQLLVESAIMLALGCVLSMLKIFELPWGGSVTWLSMLPFVLVSIKYGIKWGLGVSFLFSLFQLMTSSVFGWGLTPAILIGAIFFDYILAFTVLGIAGIFRGKDAIGWYTGITLAMSGRFFCHFISGIIFWGEYAQEFEWANGNVLLYSFIYNGAYMLPEIVFTTIGAVILLKTPQVRRLFVPALNA